MHKAGLLAVALAFPVLAQQPAAPPKSEPLDWKTLEAPILTRHVQLTTRDKFVKAGEAYFNPDGTWIIFQAVPVPQEGKEADPFYAMYVAKVKRDRFSEEITGIETPVRVSPEGSANTCGWFDPVTRGSKDAPQWTKIAQPFGVIFGSTL